MPQMYSMTVLILTLFFLICGKTFGLDIVFNLPAKLTINKEHSVILTVFHANIVEQLSVLIDVRNQANNRKVFATQGNFTTSSSVHTYHLRVESNPLPHEWTFPGPGTDVLCFNTIEVSVVSSNGPTWSHEKIVPIVKKRGHIFLQTDRPVYRPGDEVSVRFIPVDEALFPFDTPMSMSILAPNPKAGGNPLASWSKNKAASNGVFARKFRLPETPPLGQWIVKANFLGVDIVQEEYVSSFYVQEFTLPTFELAIEPARDAFILPDDEEFSINIHANFIYGEAVDGTANVRFGLFSPGLEKLMQTTHIIPQHHIARGLASINVLIANLTGGMSILRLIEDRTHLFIEVSVTEKNGGKTRSIRKDDIKFTSSPLILDLERTPRYYKPGLPFSVQVSGFYANGAVAKDVDVTVTVVATRTDSRLSHVFNETLRTCAKGSLLARFVAPVNTNSMTVTVGAQFVSSTGHIFPAAAQKEIRPQISSYGEHLQIVVPRKDFAVDVLASVEIYVTSTPVPKTVVYTITSGRNYLLKGKADLRSSSDQVLITFPVVSEMSPTAHMTAYYVTQSISGVPFIVADSAILNVEEACQGVEPETNVVTGGSLPYAGDRLDVEVTGEPNSFIGLTGVDASALSLQSEFFTKYGEAASNTRSNAFDVLRSFTPGCKVPAIPFSESAFPVVGRALVTSVSHNFHEASNARCDDTQEPLSSNERNKRSVYTSTVDMMEKADHIFGLAYECCAIGADDVSAVMTYPGDACEQRAATITLGTECKMAFLECCREAECIRNNPTRTARPCIPSFRSAGVTILISHPPETGNTVVERSVHLLRKNFAHTWFNADFHLGESGHIVLGNNSHPRIPKLPDSITAWSIRAFTLSMSRGLCIAEPTTFAVEHSLFLEVTIPQRPVIRGTRVPIDVVLSSYLPTRVSASVILEAEENLCNGVESGQDSETIRQSLPPARNGVAGSSVVRFTVIPIVAGTYNIKVKMLGCINNNIQPRIDKVIKTLRVIPEGEPRRQVQWILLDNRHAGRSRRPGNGADASTIKSLLISLPTNAVPGSEEAKVTIHSITTAFLREPLMADTDGSTSTIAQYLYRLQAIISKLEVSSSTPNEVYLTELSNKAQTAYDGLLTYARDMRQTSRDNTATNIAEPLYGFSYSPAKNSKPDLWLTCATLRTICRAAELVELEPDRNILSGSFRWILSHQAPGRRGYFTSTADISRLRRKRSLCSSSRRTSMKRDGCRKRSKRRRRPFRRQKQKRCPTRKCLRRRNAIRQLQKLPHFSSNLDRKIYRTAAVASFLSSVLKSTDPNTNANRRPRSFGAINNHQLRNSLRKAAKYIGIQTRKTHDKGASPITLAAAGRALFMLIGRVHSKIVNSIERHKVVEENKWWIKTDDDSRSLTPSQSLQVDSANVEATAYYLHLNVLQGQPYDNLANWLLEQRQANGRWVSLRDTLAAMDALGSYVAASLPSSDSVSSLRVELSSRGMSSPQSITPTNDYSEGIQSNNIKLPVSNNAVNMTATGTGKAWVEFDVGYNVISTYNAASTLSLSSATPASPSSLCPYEVSITMNRASVPKTYIIARNAISESLWKINLSVRFKSSYDSTETEDPTYVVDFGLHSDYVPISEDLEKLSNSIEKTVDHYRISQRALLLYMSGERNVSFKLKDKQLTGSVIPIPVAVFPAAFPERRCTLFYSPPGISENIDLLCSSETVSSRTSSDVCLCASAMSCPDIIGRSKSIEVTTEARKALTCHEATKFAYRVKFTSIAELGTAWYVYQGRIRYVFRSSAELQSVAKDQTQTFWVKSSCPIQKITENKEYLVIGRSVVQGNDGVFKHLLDSNSRVEQWPGRKSKCDRINNPQVNTICRKMNDYSYYMRKPGGGCST